MFNKIVMGKKKKPLQRRLPSSYSDRYGKRNETRSPVPGTPRALRYIGIFRL